MAAITQLMIRGISLEMNTEGTVSNGMSRHFDC
jgi:hypothetical protein